MRFSASIAIVFSLTGGHAQAGTCTRGNNAMILTEYKCSAKQERQQERERMQRQCMVYLPDMQDARLRAWCLKQSEKMP
jgi:t-SNARE complex subunit (syntaxin)